MILSRILMILALAVLAYLVYLTMTNEYVPTGTATETFKGLKKNKPEQFTQNKVVKFEHQPKINYEKFQDMPEQEAPVIPEVVAEPAPVPAPVPVPAPAPAPVPAPAQVPEPVPENITYDKPNVISGVSDSVHGAAPFGSNAPVLEGDMATVNYTGMVDGNPGDVIQIEGTDLLTAPLVDNMLYTNSIANTNRNASQDLRGDIPLQFNETYTPFYSSVIYGAPLSQKTMTIGTL